ncbi:hypothetical protein M501DRAFT_980931, partial [Patellaria atrata CBS 101060]
PSIDRSLFFSPSLPGVHTFYCPLSSRHVSYKTLLAKFASYFPYRRPSRSFYCQAQHRLALNDIPLRFPSRSLTSLCFVNRQCISFHSSLESTTKFLWHSSREDLF